MYTNHAPLTSGTSNLPYQFVQHPPSYQHQNYYIPPNLMYTNDYRSTHPMSGMDLQHLNHVDSHPCVPSTTQGDKISVMDSVVTNGATDLLDFSTVKTPSSVHTTTAGVTYPTASTLNTATSSIFTAQKPVPTSSSNGDSSNKNEDVIKVTLENACLAFTRSEMMRNDQSTVIDTVSKNFSLEEIKASRELLYRNTGTRSYKYVGPHDPATTSQKSAHCVTSIVNKLKELDLQNKKYQLKFLCSAEDLFRLLNFSSANSGNIAEHRMSMLENEMRDIKSKLNNANLPAPHVPSQIKGNQSMWPSLGEPASRINLLKHMSSASNASVSSPNKRRRVDETSDNNVRTPKPVLKGRPPRSGLRGAESHSIFLFNFDEEATEKDVWDYFHEQKVSVINVRFRCHPESAVKRFIMRIKNKEDFDKVVLSLPEFTGCRWYDPENRPNPNDRPKGYFNNGMLITGPGLRVKSSLQISSAIPVMSASAAAITPKVGSQASDMIMDHTSVITTKTNLENSIPIVTSSQHTASPVVTSASTNTSASTASAIISLRDSIKPLNSTTYSSAGASYPPVTVSNRFSVLQTPKFQVGGQVSLSNEDAKGDSSETPITS